MDHPIPFALCLALLLPLSDVGAGEPYHRAADNKIYAQALVESIKRENPELYWAGIHAPPREGSDYVIIASTLDIIGKKSDPNDMDVGRQGVSLLTPNDKLAKFGVMLPLKDASGRIIGALGMAFRYHDGDDQAEIYRKATVIRNRVARYIPSVAALLRPSPQHNFP